MTRDAILRLIAEINDELQALAHIQGRVQRAQARFAETPPDEFGLGGIAITLHDSYNAAENIFKRVAAELNGGLPAGQGWHVQLLRDMTIELPGLRPAVIRKETAVLLKEYLDFRHVVRHTYGFDLRWEPIKGLLSRFSPAYESLVTDVRQFLGFLQTMLRD